MPPRNSSLTKARFLPEKLGQRQAKKAIPAVFLGPRHHAN
jgi:hypothetical protein